MKKKCFITVCFIVLAMVICVGVVYLVAPPVDASWKHLDDVSQMPRSHQKQQPQLFYAELGLLWSIG